MRFLVDECTGPFVARWLREQNQMEIHLTTSFSCSMLVPALDI